MNLVLSAEHGGNRVPVRYRPDFVGAEDVLASHAGWDIGSDVLARKLARATGAPLILARTTRLLVELNRSLGHRALFSRFVSHHGDAERTRILAQHYHPHRDAVEAAVEAAPRGPVLHLSVHSFTPTWEGLERGIDVALLYDPKRERERAFASAFLGELGRREGSLRLARNRPYRGTADGLTTHLRRRLPEARYLGIELEVSQAFAKGPPAPWRQLQQQLAETFVAVLDR
ncbi:MAG: N-formylglutamate amidohydrolase [Planctomycetota bacterium]|nr:N-formylglutamate amidohydrolase [Planctomycetota bacterium]